MEKHAFQAEVRQLLDIVIHSLYTEREVFVRELVSNASDALEKFRHLQLTEKEIFDDHLELEINLTTDDTARTLTIQDFGVGMTREELVENLGTIAHSGSKAFLKALKESGGHNRNLIGQFGVGFYSAFMAARRVRVYARSWKADEKGWCWTSEGGGGFEIEEAEGQRRGCKVVLELKNDAGEFASASRIREVLRRYSSFVPFPVNLNGERINTIQALWLRPKNEIKDEEYTEFYKFQAHALDAPRHRLHFSADAPLAINALLFTPQENPERLGFGQTDPGVALYCRKILIDPSPRDLLPEWLRFLKGVADCEDLPLNISRESMQDRALLQKLGRVLTNRYLKFLSEEAEKRPDDYHEFFRRFGRFLKEGAGDPAHQEAVGKLLGFESTLTDPGKTTSLADYVGRMKEEQKEIYYLAGPDRDTLEAGPYLEAFRARNLEVLLLTDPAHDEFAISRLRTFAEKTFASADRADLSLEDIPPPPESEALDEASVRELCAWFKEVLGERASEVGVGGRLVDSPAAVLNRDRFLDPQMRRILAAAGETTPPLDIRLEINPRHNLVRKLNDLRSSAPDTATLLAEQLFDNALLAAGLHDNPRQMVARLNDLLTRL